MEHDLLKLRVLGSPQAVPFRQQLRCNGQAVRQPEQLPAVAVFLRGVLLVLLQLFKLCQQFFLYPMQTVMRLSRYGAEFGNKKSPHNNLNLTIPSGMALVRVCYVAIRKLKTCSAALRKRALLKTRHFQQRARKNNENFGEKREPDDSFYLLFFTNSA